MSAGACARLRGSSIETMFVSSRYFTRSQTQANALSTGDQLWARHCLSLTDFHRNRPS
jgi:hypothetical protein